jgi:hypothetical protein
MYKYGLVLGFVIIVRLPVNILFKYVICLNIHFITANILLSFLVLVHFGSFD